LVRVQDIIFKAGEAGKDMMPDSHSRTISDERFDVEALCGHDVRDVLV